MSRHVKMYLYFRQLLWWNYLDNLDKSMTAVCRHRNGFQRIRWKYRLCCPCLLNMGKICIILAVVTCIIVPMRRHQSQSWTHMVHCIDVFNNIFVLVLWNCSFILLYFATLFSLEAWCQNLLCSEYYTCLCIRNVVFEMADTYYCWLSAFWEVW